MLSTSSLTFLANFARWAAVAFIVVMGISMVSDFMEIGVLNALQSGSAGVPEADASDQRQAIVAVVLLIALLAAGIGYLAWVNAAYKAHKAMGVQGMKFTPNFAVGSHFIPIYNIYSLWKVMEDNWKASIAPNEDNAGAWQARKPPQILSWWYGLWFISGVIERCGFRLGGKEPTFEQLTTSAWLSIAASVIGIAAIFIHRKLVGDVNNNLVRKINLFRRGTAPPPPQPPPMQV